MIQISSLVQNNISNNISNSYCGNSSQSISYNNNNSLANGEYYTIKGLNCVFNDISALPEGSNNSPYIVIKVNNNLIISSVCKVLNNTAFWSDCLQFRLEGDQSKKLIEVEIHNYSLYQTEQDLVDLQFGDNDFLGSGVIDLSDLVQIQHQKLYVDNSSINYRPYQNEARSSQLTNVTSSRMSNNCAQSNLLQNNSITIGQAKIIGDDGTNIGSLQFNIQKEIYSNHLVNSIPMISSTQLATMQLYEERENLKSITAKFSEILPQNQKTNQILQHSYSFPIKDTSSNNYFDSQTIYKQHDFFAEQNEYKSNKQINTPSSIRNQIYQNNQNKLNIANSTFIFNPIKSINQEDDNYSLSNNGLYDNQQKIEQNQIPNYHSYNAFNEDELNSFNNNSNPKSFQENLDGQISYHPSSENTFQQLSNSNHQIKSFCYSQQQPLQSIQNQIARDFTNVSPISDIKGKNNEIGQSQILKSYVGLQSQFGQQNIHPSLIPSTMQSQSSSQTIGLINMNNIPFQSICGSAQTISTSSQRNSMNQVSYQNFSQAVTHLGSNSMNVIQSPVQHLPIQNNLMRMAQSQKNIVNKYHPNNNSTISPIISPAIIQIQNNNTNQPIAAPLGSFQKMNVSITSTRQPYSVAATPFKNQRNGQNGYQVF